MLLILRLVVLLDHLAPAVAPTALADTMRAHQLVARRAGHQRWRVEALVLAAIATAVARNFVFGAAPIVVSRSLSLLSVRKVRRLEGSNFQP